MFEISWTVCTYYRVISQSSFAQEANLAKKSRAAILLGLETSRDTAFDVQHFLPSNRAREYLFKISLHSYIVVMYCLPSKRSR